VHFTVNMSAHPVAECLNFAAAPAVRAEEDVEMADATGLKPPLPAPPPAEEEEEGTISGNSGRLQPFRSVEMITKHGTV
jgi:hypothetical protein